MPPSRRFLRLVLANQFGRRNAERVGDVVQPLEEDAAASGLHRDHNGAVDAGLLGQLLLGQSLLKPKPSDGRPDASATPLPEFDAAGVVLTGSGGHLHKKWT